MPPKRAQAGAQAHTRDQHTWPINISMLTLMFPTSSEALPISLNCIDKPFLDMDSTISVEGLAPYSSISAAPSPCNSNSFSPISSFQPIFQIDLYPLSSSQFSSFYPMFKLSFTLRQVAECSSLLPKFYFPPTLFCSVPSKMPGVCPSHRKP